MSDTLGRTIGKVDHVFSVKNDNEETVQLSVKIDFSTAKDSDIKGWLVGNRVIALQRPMRALSAKEIKALHGRTFKAEACGQKIKSREGQIAELTKVGIPRGLAEFMIDNPDQLDQLEIPKV